MTIIVKEGKEDWNHVIDKGYEKKIMIIKEKPNSIDSLVQSVKIFAEGYCQETISRVSKNVLKCATLCLKAGGDHFQQLLWDTCSCSPLF